MLGLLLSHSNVGTPICIPGQKILGSIKTVKKRILVCAPSNAACDEIIRRLRQGIPDYNGKNKFIPRIVRLGNMNSTHADVKDVTLEFLTDEHFMKDKKKGGCDDMDKKREELKTLSTKRDDLQKRLLKLENGMEIMQLDRELRHVNDRRKDLLKEIYDEESGGNNSRNNDAHGMKLKVRHKILSDAGILLFFLF